MRQRAADTLSAALRLLSAAMTGPRRQLTGPAQIAAALDAGEPVRLLLAAAAPKSRAAQALLARARAAGIPVHEASERVLWRLGGGANPAEVLGLVGPPPDAGLDEMLAAGGVAWCLVGLAYPGNTGFALRLAEVSGADGVVVESAFAAGHRPAPATGAGRLRQRGAPHEARREALRAAMRADRFMPVFWERALDVIPRARAAGRAIVAVEDSGDTAPWRFNLRQPLLLLVGGERHGIPREVLRACDSAIRIPMRGFIPSYNVQAAMAMVAGERLRQLGA